ncbi:type II secretion system protein [bacterium]|nr:type II secretion system protein [bacterium]
MKIKKNGFTLAEALITLTIVGALAVLVLPGLIKDTTSRAMIALLQSTLKNLDDAIQNELVKTRATNIKDTVIYKDPEAFFKNLDYVKYSSDNSQFKKSDGTAVAYKSVNGTSITLSDMSESVLLKNGVVIGIKNGDETSNRSHLFIDTNGTKEPNIGGVDYFILTLMHENNKSTGDHLGDIGCGGASTDTDIATCKSAGTTCFCALERSGFDPKYME